MLIQPGTSFPASVARPVTALTGAGTFLVCDINNVPHVLLGARRSTHAENDGRWVTFGGKADFGEDEDLLATAHREIYEESNGLISLPKELANAPFHDFIHGDYLFRQFFVRVATCPDVESINLGKTANSLKHNSHTGKNEYHKFAWHPLTKVMSTTPEGVMGTDGDKAFAAFAEILQVPHVRGVLEKMLSGAPITEHKQTQSMPVQASVAQVYADFVKVRAP
jgi:8-oxo-dGTP pyrophosphatase MutT (NUDIX family)